MNIDVNETVETRVAPPSLGDAVRSLTPIMGNRQRLDGGAMYGNAPKSVWAAWSPPDEQNRIALACRAFLVTEGGVAGGRPRRVLLETGIGAFFEPKLRARFGVEEPDHVLLRSLAAVGVSHEDIDVVVLSHLHFDHAGGLLSTFEEGQAPSLLFPNALVVVSDGAWARSKAPHVRDRASFIPALGPLLDASGRLRVVPDPAAFRALMGPGWDAHMSEGHTPGLLLSEVDTSAGPVVFGADLIPGMAWVHAPITMGYDRFPERLIDEKVVLLTSLAARQGVLAFTHDPAVAFGRVRVDSGRFSAVAS
ncbi:MAG: MBL fold metallo-hydrolase [Myxococcales bacterium]|nr:MBL fold metallo-hydrolase [Myxococcales bacterium]